MPLSISSSNQRLPKANWLKIWAGIIGLLIISLAAIEWHLRNIGWSPSVVDSPNLWVEQRKRASELKEKAMILVGASRMQLDMDLDVLRKESGLEPVQLAIDGTSYIPVLENLANDPDIKGTILVSVNAYNMRKGKPDDTSTQWVNYYQHIHKVGEEPYRVIHNKITALLNNNLVTRLEGAKPYTIISKLAFNKPSSGNYLITHPDRSRDADYTKVAMPNFYAARLQRHFGAPIIQNATSFEAFFAAYKKAISRTLPVKNENFSKQLDYLQKLSQKIESHGGTVIFIRFPTGKLVWEADNKKYPKQIYWSEIKRKHTASINFSDYLSLNHFIPPDGSHLDYRDKREFTSSLLKIIISANYIKSVLRMGYSSALR